MKRLLTGFAIAALTLPLASLSAQAPAKETPRDTSEFAEVKVAAEEAKAAAKEAAKEAQEAASKALQAARQKLLEGKTDGKRIEMRVERVGNIVKVGPDGKVEVTQLGGEVPMLSDEQRAKLLKNPQEFLEELLKQAKVTDQAKATEKHSKTEASSSASSSTTVDKDGHKVASHIVVTGPTMKGRIIKVGPDGKEEVSEFTIDGKDGVMGNSSEILQQLLKANEDLPESAKKHLSLSLRGALSGKPHAPAASSDAVAEKLDKVLERLEAIEHKVSELSKAK